MSIIRTIIVEDERPARDLLLNYLQEFQDFYRTYYVPQNACLVLSGDIDIGRLMTVRVNPDGSDIRQIQIPFF